MSAPDVNVDRQKSRHITMVRGLWIGVAIAVIFAVAIYGYTQVSGEEAEALLTPATAEGE
ncbi:MAG: hypothetical protein WBV71_14190 [Roseobacter sp.]